MNAMPQLANPTASPGLPALASPQMLQQRIEEKGNQPNGLPNDLLDALALQQVLENQEAAKRNMALQQAQQMGQPVPVVAQLKQKAVANARDEVGQKIATMQMMQARAQQAQAEPQGINMAQANLGRGYAGGGIIAFSGEEQSDVPKANDPNPYAWTPAKLAAALGVPAGIAKYGIDAVLESASAATGIPKAEILRNTTRAALDPLKGAVRTAARTGPAGVILAGGLAATEYAGDIMRANPELQDAYTDNYMVGALDPANALPAAIMAQGRKNSEGKTTAPAPKAEYKYGDNTPQPLRDRQSQYPRSTYVAPGTTDTTASADPEKQGVAAAAAALKVLGGGGGGPKMQEYVDPDEAALRAQDKADMAANPNKVWEDAAKRHRDYVGIDALLKGQEDDIAERKRMQAGIAAKRDPLRKFLYEFSAADPRKGLGGWMGAAGEQTTKQMDEWDTDDLKFNAEIMKLKAEVTKAKIEGREKDAKAGEDAIKEMQADKRSARQSLTSLIDTKIKSKDSLYARMESAAARLQERRIAALKIGNDTAARILEKQYKDMSDAQAKADREFQTDPEVKIAYAALEALAPHLAKHPEKRAEFDAQVRLIRDRQNFYARRALAPWGDKAKHLLSDSPAPSATSTLPPPPAGAVREK